MAEVHDPLQLWVAAREQGFPAMVRYATQRPLAVKMVLCQPLALTGVADREAATAVTDALAAWLSGDAQDAALALEALHNLVAPPLVYPPTRPPPHSRVAPAVRAALTHAPHELLASERECVEAWLGSV